MNYSKMDTGYTCLKPSWIACVAYFSGHFLISWQLLQNLQPGQKPATGSFSPGLSNVKRHGSYTPSNSTTPITLISPIYQNLDNPDQSYVDIGQLF